MPAKLIIPIGTRFNNLVTVDLPKTVKQENGSRRRFVTCKCDCGKIKPLCDIHKLKGGFIRSCGCSYSTNKKWLFGVTRSDRNRITKGLSNELV